MKRKWDYRSIMYYATRIQLRHRAFPRSTTEQSAETTNNHLKQRRLSSWRSCYWPFILFLADKKRHSVRAHLYER